ncbi:MAG: AraC family transcriptional regulator [Vallitaleaceae bacterium]|nr:AraC family transcriptional regulator [Vallitaleaceae bacterium]
MSIRGTRLFRKWLLTYLLLTVISLLFIFSIHRVYDETMREDISKLSSLYIEQLATLFEGEFRAIDRMIFSIGLDSDVISIVNMSEEPTVDNRYMIRNVVKDIQFFERANRLIGGIDLYASNSRLLIGEASTYYGQWIDVYSNRKFGISSDELDGLMKNLYRQKVTRLNHWHENKVLFNNLVYLQSLPVQSLNPTGGFIVTVNEDSLNELAEKELFPNGKILIYSEEGELLYSNDRQLYTTELLSTEVLNSGLKQVEVKNQVYIKDSLTTSYKNWTYVSLVPEEIYYDRINNTRSIIILITGVFFILNLFMAYYFTNRMYSPLRNIINSFSKDEKFNEQSEYEYIEQVINKNIEEKKKMRVDLKKQRQSLKNIFLSKVLKGQVKDFTYLEQQLEYFDVYMGEEGFLVLLIQYKSEDKGFDLLLPSFIISNVFEEILSNYVDCEMIEVDDMVACLIHNDIQGIPMDELKGHLLTAIELLRASFGMDCVLGFSPVYTYIDHIETAYHESLEAVNHCRSREKKEITFYSEIEQTVNRYEFSIDLEYQLIHFIKNGDYAKSIAIIQEVVKGNQEKQISKLSYYQFLMFDLMGAVLKATDNCNLKHALDKKDPMIELLKARSVSEMLEQLSEITKAACEVNASIEQMQSKSTLKYQIDAYIEANYSNPDLNVSKLGEVFNMTSAYLSKLYKQETGNTILYAINRVRIDASKQLLTETSMSIHDISEKVGYLYSNAFIRFFKNQTGMTPGQYKNIHMSNS